MYAIVQIGTSQYKVEEGSTIAASRVPAEIGKTINLDKVLLIADGNTVTVGQPYVPGAKVSAKVVEQGLGEKVVAFKFRKRKDSIQKIGYRKKLTALNIVKISL
ncbi:MAG: 50S ribosomal protein L21 [Candidatus Omnitrophica bacterium]|nr:50S ribosomal protein L21 [Candidatus Omnitrophota bacterium]